MLLFCVAQFTFLLLYFFLVVSNLIGRDIWTLASMLDISDPDVDAVRHAFPHDLREACRAIMRKYQQQWEGSREDAKTNLVRLLRDEPLRRNDIADRIENDGWQICQQLVLHHHFMNFSLPSY